MPQSRGAISSRCRARRGYRRSIADNGDLLVKRAGKVERRAFLAESPEAGWYDPADESAARMKLLRTIRLDPSDTFVFDPPAEAGEWAVSRRIRVLE